MANGSVVPSIAHWNGIIQLGDLQREGSFEVFDSQGSWVFLFGKPLLQAFEAVHDYRNDTITLPSPPPRNVLPNMSKQFHWEVFHWEKCGSLKGGELPPSRAVPVYLYNDISSKNAHTNPGSSPNPPKIASTDMMAEERIVPLPSGGPINPKLVVLSSYDPLTPKKISLMTPGLNSTRKLEKRAGHLSGVRFPLRGKSQIF